MRASLAVLTPEQLAEVVVSRVRIERAKGFLMQAYDIDADRAFDLLKWWSQATTVKLRVLARQLTEELDGLPQDQPNALVKTCDSLLATGYAGLGRVERAPLRATDPSSRPPSPRRVPARPRACDGVAAVVKRVDVAGQFDDPLAERNRLSH